MRSGDCLMLGETGTGNLMSLLVRSSENEKIYLTKGIADEPDGLTMSEFLGNMFIIMSAGHETMANTLAYAMLLLAANSEVQDWVGQKLQEIMQGSASETWAYEDSFPRLKRCKAVLTLCLDSPATALATYTNERPQTPEVGS
ncbi:hypothetical protein N7G274_005639 [Stereocaulon virgatum]|uniref:Cytochrome P450 n=1 Tax=Stereocaulon virgatum TaxID=373712 RepID=A0ABR4AAV8_9LECA